VQAATDSSDFSDLSVLIGENEPYCKLCLCDKAQAWPRICNPKRSLDFHYRSFRGADMMKAILDGCRACELLKDGIEHFQPLRLLEELEEERARFPLTIHRDTDDRWIVDLGNRPKLVLEFTESLGK
jgi:hypothetical protein